MVGQLVAVCEMQTATSNRAYELEKPKWVDFTLHMRFRSNKKPPVFAELRVSVVEKSPFDQR